MAESDRTFALNCKPDETGQDIIDFHRRVWKHSDATIEAVPIDAEVSRQARACGPGGRKMIHLMHLDG